MAACLSTRLPFRYRLGNAPYHAAATCCHRLLQPRNVASGVPASFEYATKPNPLPRTDDIKPLR